jgi:hypothetical protein
MPHVDLRAVADDRGGADAGGVEDRGGGAAALARRGELPRHRHHHRPPGPTPRGADRPAERSVLRGESAAGEARKLLDLTVRGNEVLLWVRTETGNGWDIAVGLYDFQDALEDASDAA